MRAALATAALLALPAGALAAWEAGRSGPVCTLRHATPTAEVLLTHDPAGPLYSITITRADPWPESALFAMRFDGPAPLTITTDRHVLSQGGRALTVTDRGFGNVLAGLAGNAVALAVSGAAVVVLPLDGAAEPVADFAACDLPPAA